VGPVKLLILALILTGCVGSGDGCEPGAVQCVDNVIESCDQDGDWGDGMYCDDFGLECAIWNDGSIQCGSGY